MTALMAATLYVKKDEPVFMMAEMDLPSPGSKGKRRYNLLYVNRDDALAEYREDLGPSGDFAAPPFRQIVLWEHTVAECLDIAEQLRWKDDYWQKRTRELQQASTLTKDFLNHYEEAGKQIRGESTFGPWWKRQRAGV